MVDVDLQKDKRVRRVHTLTETNLLVGPWHATWDCPDCGTKVHEFEGSRGDLQLDDIRDDPLCSNCR